MQMINFRGGERNPNRV